MTEPVHAEDRRSRRRFGLLWFAGALVLVVAGTAAATTWVLRGTASPKQVVTAVGSGVAPVLEAPPSATADPSPTDTFGPPPVFSTPTPERDLAAGVSSAQNASHVQTPASTPTVTSTAVSSTAPVPARDHGLHLLLSATVSDLLRPGVIRTMYVTVRNPDSVPIQLYRLDVSVAQPPAAGCDPTWVRVGRYRYAGGAKEIVPAGSSVTVDLPIELVDLATVDQNACQGTTFPVTMTGIGVSTP